MPSVLRPRLLAGFGSLVLAMGLLGVLALWLMNGLSDRATRIATENIPELVQAGEVRVGLQRYRQAQLAHLLEPTRSGRGRIEGELFSLGAMVSADFNRLGAVVPEVDEKTEVASLAEAWQRYVRQSSPSLAPRPTGDDPLRGAVLSGSTQATFASLSGDLEEFLLEERAEANAINAASAREYRIALTTFVTIVCASVLGAAILGAWLLVVRPLRRAASGEAFRRDLHEALEMADDEDEAIDVMARALGDVCPDTPVELLLADSSRSHLRRAAVAGPEPAGPGCAVDAPRACAAVRRGQTTVFASSESVGACPKLRGRAGGACSAVCTPVTVLGRTIGVVHATGAPGRPPSANALDALQTAGAQIGSRLGVVRAMAQSQLQASTDPLTGLLNRRSLEDRVRDLRRARTPFAVAMADLDHFKTLNDSFGHETGDRALRLFSRTLAQTVRVQDIVARHGGEEFVVVFPLCSAREAAEIIERVRTVLLSALTGAEVPAFTCSAGVAEAGPGESFHDVLRAADEALLGAKRSGRDRVLIASSIREVVDAAG